MNVVISGIAMLGSSGTIQDAREEIRCNGPSGRWFRFLASYGTQVPRLTADGYRAVFGLRTRTGLMSPAMKERRREQTAPLLRRFAGAGLVKLRAMAAEEWRAINRGRRWRLEGRLDPRNRQAWLAKTGTVSYTHLTLPTN